MIPIEKIELMLKVYREKLEKASQAPADYLACIQLEAKIGLLENLYYYALHDEKENTPKETSTFRVCCHNCYTTSEHSMDDVKTHTNESGTIKYVLCANCKEINTLETIYPE